MSEQRKRFEAAMGDKLYLEPIEYADGSFHYYADRVTRLCFEAWQKACPEGWQAVPKRADDHMKLAGWKVKDNPGDSCHQIWNAMRDAALKPEDVCK